MYGTDGSIPTDFEPRTSGARARSRADTRYLPNDGTPATNVGLCRDHRAKVVSILNTVLADEFVLYTKSRRFHWNVEGPNFSELHELFQKQYEQLAEIVDDAAVGSLKEYLDLARLNEEWSRSHDARGMIATLLADHETLIRELREDLEICSKDHGDEGTTDFLTGLMQIHEKTAWMLRSYLR